MSFLSALLGQRNRPASANAVFSATSALPAPEQPIFVIGDIHGRADLLERILEQLDAEIGALKLRDPKLVFVGNLIDHGPSSARVVSRMRELTREFPNNVVCLLGSHEQMLLDFLAAPAARYARWMKEGAPATFASFGVSVSGENMDAGAATEAAKILRDSIGPEVLDWIGGLPSLLSSGTLHVVHAAADPRRAMDDQTARVLTWGHPEFLTVARSDGQWVAHGHTRFERPLLKDNRISVDTGAWETGILSSAMILPDGQVGFVQATLPDSVRD
jgi:serine/threonine protein phosphatase 1